MTNKAVEKDGIKYFACRQCGELKPLNKDNFYVNTRSILGFNSSCRCCLKGKYKPKVKYITRAELEEENKKLKENLDKREYYDKVNGLDKFVEMSNEMAELEKENKNLKEELSKYKKQY